VDELAFRRTAQKLEAEQLRVTLIQAGLYLVAFELLKNDVVDRTKGFFQLGFDSGGLIYSPDYQSKVLSLAPNKFDASARWLVTVDALTADQADELIELRQHRNEIAHELPNLLIDPSVHFSPDRLARCRFYVDLLGLFWGRILVDTDPAYDGREVEDSAIKSGTSLLLDHIWAAVHGAT
jgi:hypothetical protein